ncbi:MAG: DUF429 domain-containing protein, partial [Pseudomonadota bacterium]
MPATGAGELPSLQVMGVDGCPSGWFAVFATKPDGCEGQNDLSLSWALCPSFEELMADPRAKAVKKGVVDIPMGLGDQTARPCDALARKALSGKASSIFTP